MGGFYELKKILCSILAISLSVCLFAQNTKSDLERISLDYAERLIRDGASEEKIAEISQYLSESSREYLEQYRELNGLLQRPSKINKNRALIAEKAGQFSGDEREDLYNLHLVRNKAWSLNIVPGFGIGSFVQGDVGGGIVELGLDSIILGIVLNSISNIDSDDDHKSSKTGTMWAIGGIAFVLTNSTFGTIRPSFFKRSRNAMLRESLSLNKKGKAIAQNTNEVQFSFAPIVNPVADQYGAVALIRF